MAETAETRVKRRIKDLLKTHRAYFTMPVMTGMATNGTPDFAVCHRGRYAAVEAKAGKGTPTELQWVRLTDVMKAGGSAMVINENNLDVLEHWLQVVSTVHVGRKPDSKAVLNHFVPGGTVL